MGNCSLLSTNIGLHRHRVDKALALNSEVTEFCSMTDSDCDSLQFWSLNSQAFKSMPEELMNRSFLVDKAMTPSTKKGGELNLKSPKTAVNLSSFPLAQHNLDLQLSHV